MSTLDAASVLDRRRLTWGITLAYAALLFVLSELEEAPNAGLQYFIPDLQQFIEESDKLLHLLAYSVLGLLLSAALAGPRPISERCLWAAVLLTAVYGVSDEFHQSFVPLRTASGWDTLADAVGGWVGATAFRWWREGARRP